MPYLVSSCTQCSSYFIVTQALFALMVNCIRFQFIPSPNITVLQSASYSCSVLESDDVSIYWKINKTISTDENSFQSLSASTGIAIESVNKTQSVLTIPGNPSLNRTRVECIAVGHADGKLFNRSGFRILYLQGVPPPVTISASLQSLNKLKINWSAPYVLPGISITGYNIKISDDIDVKHIKVDMNLTGLATNYSYSASYSANYSIVVVAFIEDSLESEKARHMIEVPKVMKIKDWKAEVVKFTDDNKWTIKCRVWSLKNLPPPLTLYLGSSSFSWKFELKKQSSHELQIINITGEVTIESTTKLLHVFLIMEYENQFKVFSVQNEIELFRVQNLIISDNPLQENVCFKCIYISHDSMASLNCMIFFTADKETRILTITSFETECVKNIQKNTYNISVYDIESNGAIFTNFPTYQTTKTMGMILHPPSPVNCTLTPTVASTSRLSVFAYIFIILVFLILLFICCQNRKIRYIFTKSCKEITDYMLQYSAQYRVNPVLPFTFSSSDATIAKYSY